MPRSAALHRHRRQRGQSLLQTLVGSMVLFGLYFGGTPVLGVAPRVEKPADDTADYAAVLRTVSDEIQSSSGNEVDVDGLRRLRSTDAGAVDRGRLTADFPSTVTRNSQLCLQELEGYGVTEAGDVGIRWGEPVVYRVESGALVRVQGAQQRVVAKHVVAFHAQRSASGTMDVVLVTGDSGAYEEHRVSAAPLN